MIGSAAAVGGHVGKALVQVAARRCTMKRTLAISNAMPSHITCAHARLLAAIPTLPISQCPPDAIKRSHDGLICAICFASRAWGLLGTV